MRTDRQLKDEGGRLAAVRRYDVLDTPAEEPFDKLTELVRNVLSVPIAAVSLIDANRQWFKSISGFSACELPRDISFCTHAITRREPMIVPDATLDVRFAKNPMVTSDPFVRSYLGIPLETPDGYNLGALCAIDLKPRNFSAHEIAILTSFAKLVVNELELRQIANTDGLTGAMTRRGWVDACGRELERSLRYGTASSIILFDIDHFKSINDAHGHPAGDEVLRAIVQRCGATLRDSDSLGRIGGEEFAILLPETAAAGAMDLAERLRQQFADTPVMVNGTELDVTASFGVSTRSSTIKDVDGWLSAADALLYRAKVNGRNRCEASTEPSMTVC